MKLTGKCKEDFEKWYNKQDFKISYVTDVDGTIEHWNLEYNEEWKELPDSMKYGVLVDFFDSVDIRIEIQIRVDQKMNCVTFMSFRPEILHKGEFRNVSASFGKRDRARTAAIEKANAIYNGN